MNFTMSRDRIVVSKFGRAIEFKKGVSTHVPEMCWEECQAQGAVPDDDLPEPDVSVPVAPQGAERAAALAAAIKTMVLRAQRDDFTASGAPNVAVLATAAGFAIDAKERDVAWAAAQNEE